MIIYSANKYTPLLQFVKYPQEKPAPPCPFPRYRLPLTVPLIVAHTAQVDRRIAVVVLES